MEMNEAKYYLGTRLNVADEETGEKFEVCGIRLDNDELLIYDNIDGSVVEYCIDLLKPIMLPLSSLSKPCLKDGKIPIVEICKMRSFLLTEDQFDKASKKMEYDIFTKRLPFDMMNQLIEWNFDVFGLIAKGQAIDINTLPK
jgi:hypothetical protein